LLSIKHIKHFIADAFLATIIYEYEDNINNNNDVKTTESLADIERKNREKNPGFITTIFFYKALRSFALLGCLAQFYRPLSYV
jgi:hypothetical protein